MTDEQADELLGSAAGMHVDQMLRYAAVGTPAEVSDYLEDFRKQTEADEFITVHQSPNLDGRLRSITLLAEAMQ
jgi:alkanesulfonate monooxygenase SsuD/methylene tetrahydromethanopterin reductase-like flavin-dependent oxidoreductase (luciferase family)